MTLNKTKKHKQQKTKQKVKQETGNNLYTSVILQRLIDAEHVAYT